MAHRRQEIAARKRLASLFPAPGPWTRAALGSGLVDEALPTTSIEDELDVIRRQRLTTFAAEIASRAPSTVPERVRTSLQRASFDAAVATHGVTIRADRVIAALTGAGVSAVVVKGPALARWYRNPALRAFGDVDVVVSPNQFTHALGHLRAAGWSEFEESRQPHDFFQRWCRESVNLYHPEHGHADLHHRPSPWIWGTRIGAQEMSRGASSVAFGQIRLPCAGIGANALVAALQLITDHQAPGSKLLAWRDLAELGRVDPAAIADLANATALGGVLRALLSGMPDRLLPRELESRLDSEIANPGRLVTLLESADRGAYLRTHMARLPAANALVYGAGTLVPSRAFLRSRFPQRRIGILAWWRDLFGNSGDGTC